MPAGMGEGWGEEACWEGWGKLALLDWAGAWEEGREVRDKLVEGWAGVGEG